MALPEADCPGQRYQPQAAQTLLARSRHGGRQQALGNAPTMPFGAHGAVVDEPVPARFGQRIQQLPQRGRQPVVPRIRDQIARHPVAGQRHQASPRRKLLAVPEELHRLQHRQPHIGLRLHLHQLRQVGFFQRRYLYGHMAQTMVRERQGAHGGRRERKRQESGRGTQARRRAARGAGREAVYLPLHCCQVAGRLPQAADLGHNASRMPMLQEAAPSFMAAAMPGW